MARHPSYAGTRARGLLADAGSLTIGTGIAGLAAYAYLLLGTNTYGADGFAPLSVVWSIWLIAGTAFAFPLEQWITRALTSGLKPADLARPLRNAAGLIAISCAATSVVSARLAADVFGGSPVLPVIAGVLAAQTALLGAARGVQAGRGRFARAAAVSAGENVVRLIGGVTVVILGGDITSFGLALLLGPLGLIVLLKPSPPPRVSQDVSSALADGRTGLARTTLISSAMQLAVSSPPVIAAALGAADVTVTAVFATITLLRAPHLLLVGASSSLTAFFTATPSWRPGRGRSSLLICGAAVVGAALTPMVQPVVAVIFGGDARLDVQTTLMLTIGMAVGLATLVLTLAAQAAGAWTSAAAAWVSGLLLGALVCVLLAGHDPGFMVAGTLLTTQIVPAVLLALHSPDASRLR